MARVTGKTMDSVYDWMKTLTIQQLKDTRDIDAVKFLPNIYLYKLYIHQCNYAIEKKLSGKW